MILIKSLLQSKSNADNGNSVTVQIVNELMRSLYNSKLITKNGYGNTSTRIGDNIKTFTNNDSDIEYSSFKYLNILLSPLDIILERHVTNDIILIITNVLDIVGSPKDVEVLIDERRIDRMSSSVHIFNMTVNVVTNKNKFKLTKEFKFSSKPVKDNNTPIEFYNEVCNHLEKYIDNSNYFKLAEMAMLKKYKLNNDGSFVGLEDEQNVLTDTVNYIIEGIEDDILDDVLTSFEIDSKRGIFFC